MFDPRFANLLASDCRYKPDAYAFLEEALAYIEDDELVEVTPESIRLRKKELVPHLRKRAKAEVE